MNRLPMENSILTLLQNHMAYFQDGTLQLFRFSISTESAPFPIDENLCYRLYIKVFLRSLL
jgi:hypothetical protein